MIGKLFEVEKTLLLPNLTPNKFKLKLLMNDSKYCKPTLICMREFSRGKRKPCLRE